jgi:hypothetical protein
MKKIHLTFILVFAIVIQTAFTQNQETFPVRLEKISGNLYEILDGRGSNGGAYIGDNGILVIDAKMDLESVDQTISELKKIADKPILYLGWKKVELWYFGTGHTTGDLVVYIPEEKTAFLGDQLFLTRPQLIHSYKGGKGDL